MDVPSVAIDLAKVKNAERHMPGEAGIWVFIFGDMLVFSSFFIVFMVDRSRNVSLYSASQEHLSQFFGVLNTFFMLSSSWFVATAVIAARRNLGKITPVCFFLGWLCAFGFVINKFFEYGEKIRAGIRIDTNDFFMYYFMFTGFHLMHVLIGMGVLAFAAWYSWRGNYTPHRIRNLESSASFWHVVDLLWIMLFALLYLIK